MDGVGPGWNADSARPASALHSNGAAERPREKSGQRGDAPVVHCTHLGGEPGSACRHGVATFLLGIPIKPQMWFLPDYFKTAFLLKMTYHSTPRSY